MSKTSGTMKSGTVGTVQGQTHVYRKRYLIAAIREREDVNALVDKHHLTTVDGSMAASIVNVFAIGETLRVCIEYWEVVGSSVVVNDDDRADPTVNEFGEHEPLLPLPESDR